jgi:hypothetical protein
MTMRNLKWLKRWGSARITTAIAGGLCITVACGFAVSTSSRATAGRESTPVRDVLRGDGIRQAGFGENPATATRRLDALLGRSPGWTYSVVHACHIDHTTGWPGLIIFFQSRRFVGYTFETPKHPGHEPTLATLKGLRVGNTLARGRELYGPAFHWSPEQGGSWSVGTVDGRLIGFASGLPIGSRSTVFTIEAGDVGCPAMTP